MPRAGIVSNPSYVQYKQLPQSLNNFLFSSYVISNKVGDNTSEITSYVNDSGQGSASSVCLSVGMGVFFRQKGEILAAN